MRAVGEEELARVHHIAHLGRVPFQLVAWRQLVFMHSEHLLGHLDVSDKKSGAHVNGSFCCCFQVLFVGVALVYQEGLELVGRELDGQSRPVQSGEVGSELGERLLVKGDVERALVALGQHVVGRLGPAPHLL